MTQIERKVTLLAHTQLSQTVVEEYLESDIKSLFFDEDTVWKDEVSDGQAVALTAIRTCYSPGKPSEIVAKEGKRYFGKKASDGGTGTEADRLVRMIQSSKHTSVYEHLSYTFAVEGVSRALLAQLTRHRVGFSYSVQSQRYVKFGSDDRSGGFDYVLPDTITDKVVTTEIDGNEYVTSAKGIFEETMSYLQDAYDALRKAGVPAEDCRAVLPNAAACNLVLTVNLRALLDFYAKRKAGRGAQSEITQLAEELKNAVIAIEPWTAQLFEAV